MTLKCGSCGKLLDTPEEYVDHAERGCPSGGDGLAQFRGHPLYGAGPILLDEIHSLQKQRLAIEEWEVSLPLMAGLGLAVGLVLGWLTGYFIR